MINECIAPWFIKDMTYIDSSSSMVKRRYDLGKGDKAATAMKGYTDALAKEAYMNKENLKSIAEITGGDDYYTGTYANSWLQKFEIADKLKITKDDTDEDSYKIYLIQDDEERLLADDGYGITQLVVLLLQIENSIIDRNSSTKTHPHHYIAIEEPEMHLHPKYQSLLADLFVESYQNYNIHFIIETHSEYLIRKLQVLVADKNVRNMIAAGATADAIAHYAMESQGMESIKMAGLRLVEEGITTMEELQRIAYND